METFGVKPYSPIAQFSDVPTERVYAISLVAPVVGMAESFIRRIVGNKDMLSEEQMVRRLIERITVYEDHLDFEFKSGLETEVQM